MTHKIFPIIALGGALGVIYLFRNQISQIISSGTNAVTTYSNSANMQTGASGGQVLSNGAEAF